jgi:hypothetical protein
MLVVILNQLLTPRLPASTTSPWLLIYALVLLLVVPVGALCYVFSFEARRWQNSDLIAGAPAEIEDSDD